MPMPRKVPWRSLDELAQVQGWIFDNEHDTQARQQGLNRLKTWVHLHPSTHPIAISSALSLLSSLSLLTTVPRPDPHSIRLSLAASLVRFINTLVDPYQTGQFARPIAMISAELGIPGWLVELRHAGTHENLPSLEVLTEGSQEALNYLNVSFFLPTLNLSSQSFETMHTVSPFFQSHKALLPSLLKQYKTLSKSITKDHSTSQTSFRQLQRNILRWLEMAEMRGGVGMGVKVLAEALVGFESDQEGLYDRIEAGGLIPISKKKRSSFTPETPYPPSLLLEIYTPLLTLIPSTYPSFASTLAYTIITVLENPRSRRDKDDGEDTLASWLVWVFDRLLEDEDRTGVVKDLIRNAWDSERSRKVLRAISLSHPNFEFEVSSLLDMLESKLVPVQYAPLEDKTEDSDDLLGEMEARLEQIRNLTRQGPGMPTTSGISNQPTASSFAPSPPHPKTQTDSNLENRLSEAGWSVVSEEEWGEGLPMGSWIEV
ncbi:Nuclear protein involved in cell morphogenesis and cell surface growth [Phaffia rhodozyma]|uniref:Nuclear protein involved in cell morphogenesis and cell surface growth n=1 Tax=Phaffia rhodozyma TaxID=264483 RepID=A0A0F7SLA1_PHARH|nr:Nuclear protein involved in cell morphogenesis and cell surface growth [Phaffia rhodozyma]